MLDFSPVRNKKMTFQQLVAGLTQVDLGRLTNEMIDAQLRLIAACLDCDVVFVPLDPDADDPYAATEAEKKPGLDFRACHCPCHRLIRGIRIFSC
jgi:hypothetical protein